MSIVTMLPRMRGLGLSEARSLCGPTACYDESCQGKGSGRQGCGIWDDSGTLK
jgi:hypothetical protein